MHQAESVVVREIPNIPPGQAIGVMRSLKARDAVIPVFEEIGFRPSHLRYQGGEYVESLAPVTLLLMKDDVGVAIRKGSATMPVGYRPKLEYFLFEGFPMQPSIDFDAPELVSAQTQPRYRQLYVITFELDPEDGALLSRVTVAAVASDGTDGYIEILDLMEYAARANIQDAVNRVSSDFLLRRTGATPRILREAEEHGDALAGGNDDSDRANRYGE